MSCSDAALGPAKRALGKRRRRAHRTVPAMGDGGDAVAAAWVCVWGGGAAREVGRGPGRDGRPGPDSERNGLGAVGRPEPRRSGIDSCCCCERMGGREGESRAVASAGCLMGSGPR